jgi:hypothetical protein
MPLDPIGATRKRPLCSPQRSPYFCPETRYLGIRNVREPAPQILHVSREVAYLAARATPLAWRVAGGSFAHLCVGANGLPAVIEC